MNNQHQKIVLVGSAFGKADNNNINAVFAFLAKQKQALIQKAKLEAELLIIQHPIVSSSPYYNKVAIA